MKALSLRQPWASLVAHNWKHWETRSWNTSYRGILLIHAAKSTELVSTYFRFPAFARCLMASGYATWEDLPFGALLGITQLKETKRVEEFRHLLGDDERAFGNYNDHRFGFHLGLFEPFVKPILFRGKLGIFDCELPEDYLKGYRP